MSTYNQKTERPCFVNYSINPVKAEYAEALYDYLMEEVCLSRSMGDESLSFDVVDNFNTDVISVVRYQFGTKNEAEASKYDVGEHIAHYVDAWIKSNAVSSSSCR